MPTRWLTDALGTPVQVPLFPQRVVSLCPSQTETLLALGIGERLVGRTKFCIHPQPAIGRVAVVGGTKQVRLDALRSLRPDLIIAEKEEQTPELVATLRTEWPVYVTDVRDYATALHMLATLGELTGLMPAAAQLVKEIETEWRAYSQPATPQRVAYFIWREPWMLAGPDTFIHSALAHAGLQNCVPQGRGRYPAVALQQVAQWAPQRVLLSSEPYPFGAQHVHEVQAALPSAQVQLVDGELFSWYGARMRLMPRYWKIVMSGNG
jgi:ABC-type Fe3+-hydroxamate transport system substrate-binding protein